MPGVFVSYRRDDAGGWAQNIHDRLAQRFGAGRVFMDVEDIPAAVDFTDFITQRLRDVDALVAIIGNEWASAVGDTGQPRIHEPDDLLRREIAIALMLGIKVVPVLVDNAAMPRGADLPEDLRPLTRLNAVELRPSSFSDDSDRLIQELARFVPDPPLTTWQRMTTWLRRRPVAAGGTILGGAVGVIVLGVLLFNNWNGTPPCGRASPPASCTTTTEVAESPSSTPGPVVPPPEAMTLQWMLSDSRAAISLEAKYWEKYQADTGIPGLYLRTDDVTAFGDFLELLPDETFHFEDDRNVWSGTWTADGDQIILTFR